MKTVHRKISVSQPDVIKTYNKMMGGVDLVDQQIASYRPRIRKRKWWWPIWTWSLSLMLVNSWCLWNILKVGRKEKMNLLTFLHQVVTELLTKHGEQRLRTGPSMRLQGPAKDSVQADRKDHWIIKMEINGVCQHCKKRSCYRCRKCDVVLHPDCFTP